MMRRKKSWRRPKLRFYLVIALSSLYICHSVFLHRYVRINSDIEDQDDAGNGSLLPLGDHLGRNTCNSMNASYTLGGIIDDSVFRQWKYIDETIEREYPNVRVSGGIFLYPRQAYILTHLIKRVHMRPSNRQKTITICETGFG